MIAPGGRDASDHEAVPEPIGKIAPQPWITAPETVAVVEALAAEGAEVRFVGGCVRDAVLQRPVEDIDIATPEPPDKVIALLEKAGIKAVPTGVEHGTVTAVIGEVRVEVTTLRVDVETDGRRAKVAFTDDWTADAARRDFTINTLSCTPAGDIYDPMGGLDDLGHRRVRFVGNAETRIEEDVLRLLRFFRMYAVYGRPPPDIAALAACRAMAPRLSGLSGERVRDEMLRILMAPAAADTVVLMQGEGVLEHVLPEAGDVGRLRMLTWLDTSAIKVDSVAADPLRRLAALLDVDAAGAGSVAARLRLSNQQTDRLVRVAPPPHDLTPDVDDRSLRRALRRAGADVVRDRVLLAWAGELAVTPRRRGERTQAWLDTLAAADAWTPVEFPLKGRDVTALGVAEGPRVGALLGAVEAWWEDGDYRAGRTACLEKLGALAGGDQ
ncbi:MAG: CCA tRNA nucleotidyltransferase [Rhodospirillales bacterium]